MLCVVHIEEIRDRGLDVERTLPVEFVTAAIGKSGSGFQAQEPAHFKGHFDIRSGRVLLEGQLKVQVSGPCKRCLTPVPAPLDIQFALNFVKESGGRSTPGESEDRPGDPDPRASFQLEDVDTEPFDGHRIILDALLEEQMVLALPMDLLCRPDCLGLCVVCGQDRNAVACSHEQRPPDPRWEALKSVKLPN